MELHRGWQNLLYKKKNKNTTKANHVEIVVHINSFISNIIKTYSVEGKRTDYVFPILSGPTNELTKMNAVKTFTRFINQHIKTLAKKAGVTESISTVWARHSFTTSVIRLGGTMEFVQESLGHQNIKTTMNYWAGFDNDYRKNISEKLLLLTNPI